MNRQKDAAVRVSYLWGRFKVSFLGKEEQPFGGSILRYGKLSRSSANGLIIEALGGEAKAETTLTERVENTITTEWR